MLEKHACLYISLDGILNDANTLFKWSIHYFIYLHIYFGYFLINQFEYSIACNYRISLGYIKSKKVMNVRVYHYIFAISALLIKEIVNWYFQQSCSGWLIREIWTITTTLLNIVICYLFSAMRKPQRSNHNILFQKFKSWKRYTLLKRNKIGLLQWWLCLVVIIIVYYFMSRFNCI